MVLYRFNSTGVQDVLQKAIELVDAFPVYPVRNLVHFTSDRCVRSKLVRSFLFANATPVLIGAAVAFAIAS